MVFALNHIEPFPDSELSLKKLRMQNVFPVIYNCTIVPNPLDTDLPTPK
jgi:hypothetical protein